MKGVEIMMYLEWFVETMKKTFNIDVKTEEVGYVAYDFYQDEIDDLLIPAEHLKKLPDPLLIETLSYVDEGYSPSARQHPNNIVSQNCSTSVFYSD